ncbi:site-specific integrase [Rubidibacter lacunae]|nr:site-specific integrase [Rubidibacter lacunae]
MRKNRLLLRSTLPPKPGSDRKEPHQQRIFLGVHANPAGVKVAEAKAREISAQLDLGSFSWESYGKSKPVETIPETEKLVQCFREHYFSTRQLTETTHQTWCKDYLRVFRELPPHEELTVARLERAVLATEPGTRLRDRFCVALGALAKFADLPFDTSKYRGKKSTRRINPRDLPDDRTIAEWFLKLSTRNPQWGWVYGIIAAYGLRPSEVWLFDTEAIKNEPGIISVLAGKTGYREGVMPLYPEWWQEWGLFEVKLPTNNSKDIGRAVGQYFRRAGVPFKPYDLRHAWAGRAAKFGIDTGSAAYQMGHSVQIHHTHYGHWYNDRHQRLVFSLILQRADRPMAPELPAETEAIGTPAAC